MFILEFLVGLLVLAVAGAVFWVVGGLVDHHHGDTMTRFVDGIIMTGLLLCAGLAAVLIGGNILN